MLLLSWLKGPGLRLLESSLRNQSRLRPMGHQLTSVLIKQLQRHLRHHLRQVTLLDLSHLIVTSLVFTTGTCNCQCRSCPRLWGAQQDMVKACCGWFSDAGAAPAAGVSRAAHHTADAALTLIAKEVLTSNRAALEGAEAVTAVIVDTPLSQPGPPHPAKRKKKERHKSGTGSKS